jgi:polar amino acid transport system substrate-binding protein
MFRTPRSTASTLEQIRAQHTLTIGYANEAPFAYLDPNTNEVTGEAVEVMRVIAKKLGITQVNGVLTEFGALIPGLQAERYDVIAAGMYITAPRATQVAFTNPTYVVKEGFIVAKGNPKQIHGYDDVAKSDQLRLGVVAGAVEHGYAKKLLVPDDRLVVFPDNASAIAGLRADRCDAVAMTSLTIRDLLQRGAESDLETAEPFTEPVIDGEVIRGYGAYAVRLADSDLRDAFNKELHTYLGSPEHAALVAPFGFGPEHQPAGMTVEKLLKQKGP